MTSYPEDAEAAGDEMYYASRQEFVSQEAEHWEFERGAEDMELRALRMEAEAEADREAAGEREHQKWLVENFRKNLNAAKKAMAEKRYDDAFFLASDAREGAATAGRRLLAAALIEAAVKVRNAALGE